MIVRKKIATEKAFLFENIEDHSAVKQFDSKFYIVTEEYGTKVSKKTGRRETCKALINQEVKSGDYIIESYERAGKDPTFSVCSPADFIKYFEIVSP
jgi:hypothetical protein